MQVRPFAALLPRLSMIEGPDAFFETLKETFPQFHPKGYFKAQPDPAFYLYQIEGSNSKATGLIAAVPLEVYQEGRIHRHERTIPVQERQQQMLLAERGAAVKPVLLTYRKNHELNELLVKLSAGKPELTVEFPRSAETHRIWAVEDAASVKALQKACNQFIPEAFIADGHHRMACQVVNASLHPGSKVAQQVMCAFFSEDQLSVFPFFRLVELGNFRTPDILDQLGTFFTIRPIEHPAIPSQKGQLLFGIKQQWYRLEWQQAVLHEYPKLLDVELLREKVWPLLLQTSDERNDPRITYFEGVKGLDLLAEKLRQRPDLVAFCPPAVDVPTMMHIAGGGGILPPKSTWFEPRMRNGLVIYPLESRLM